MITAYVSIGSNVDKYLHTELAIKALIELDLTARFSTIYESAAFGFHGDSFFNLIAEVKTTETLDAFARTLRDIEFRLGRTLNAKKKQDRTVDLDIILFGDCISEEVVKVPRQDIYDYPFVIQPLYELCPDLVIPGDGRTVGQIWQRFNSFVGLTKVELWFN
jgi:2-amino-4-hydroxy-6-hydroxymethyldihydropteridine diphosphokinase